MSLKYSDMKIGTLSSLLHESKKPVLLLGAGCSVKSGIPTATEFVSKAAKWGYARENGIPPDITNIRRSDWLPWLKLQTWYNPNDSFADNYPSVVENLLKPRGVRKDFLQKVLSPQIPPSRGYEQLSDLIGVGAFKTILTTNFDSLIDESCRQNKTVHGHQLVKNSDEIIKITTNSNSAQIIHLHGDIETYTDKNLLNEISSLNEKIVERLVPIIRDHPLIVIGYRGAEDSIMKGLLASQVDKCDRFPNGIYWCHYDKSSLDDIPENVNSIASLIGSNFQLIKTPSFEDVIDEIWYNYTHYVKSGALKSTHEDTRVEINDLKLIDSVSISQFDRIVMNRRIANYCHSLNVWKPDRLDDEWLTNFQLERDLIGKKNEKLCPTFSGFVLFGSNVKEVLPNVSIEVFIENNPVWLNEIFGNDNEDESERIELTININGNLWEQLDEITDLLSQFNKPFRLKGEISTDVFPYPPLALKELLVNAIVHKDYSNIKPIVINITPTYISIKNSGGLMDDLKKGLGESSILDTISDGKRGLKSYRNPVIADFFYGSGAMDKAGSGLADVFSLAKDVNSQVLFGPNNENTEFNAKIFARPESIDYITRTATKDSNDYSTFVSNILEITSLPDSVYIAYTNDKFPDNIWEKHIDDFIPPFQFQGPKILSFFPLDSVKTPLSLYIDKSSMEEMSFEDFADDGYNDLTVVRLFNKCIEAHLASIGLVVDRRKKRAYFPAIEKAENRTMSYQARVKRATRVVAKQIINKKTEEVLYWEHKAVNYHIKNFGGVWSIALLPGYVFTVNGEKWLVRHDKISKLATRRSSIDYNKTVLNDLYFWLNIISKGEKNNFWINTDSTADYFSAAKILGLSSKYPKLNINQIGTSEGLEGNDYKELDEIETQIANTIQQNIEEL